MYKSTKILFILFCFAFHTQSQVIQSAMINACKTEGLNEYLIIKNGNSGFTATATNIDIRYGTSSPASTTITDQLLTSGNASYIAGLNSKLSGGCDFSFINATNTTTIPANTYFMVMHETPDDTNNFSSWCGSGTGDKYVVFSNDASWSSGGIFLNDSRSNTRYLRSIINGVTLDYNYGGINLSSDGGYVTWNDTAGTYSGSGTYSNCTPTNLQSLPVSFLNFNATIENDITALNWATASEFNNDYFTLETNYSNSGNWEFVANIKGHLNKQSITNYEYNITKHPGKTAYYRLSQTDIDGKETVLGITSVQEQKRGLSILGKNTQNLFISSDNHELPILVSSFNLNGSLLSTQEFKSFDSIIAYPLTIVSSGVQIIKIQQGNQIILRKYFQ